MRNLRSLEPLFEGTANSRRTSAASPTETLLLPYLRGAADIRIVDPYIRLPHQGATWSTCFALVASAKDPADEIAVNSSPGWGRFQQQHLLMLKGHQDGACHGRHQVHRRGGDSSGWKILLSRSLDIFKGFRRNTTMTPAAKSSARPWPSALPTSINVRVPGDYPLRNPGVTGSDATRWFWIGRLAQQNNWWAGPAWLFAE